MIKENSSYLTTYLRGRVLLEENEIVPSSTAVVNERQTRTDLAVSERTNLNCLKTEKNPYVKTTVRYPLV